MKKTLSKQRLELTEETIKTIDEKRLGWVSQFPSTIQINEAYISSIKYYCYELNKPYYCVELAFELDSKWINIDVYMHFNELKNILIKSTNFPPESLIEGNQLKQHLFIEGALSIRELFDTYFHCEDIDLTALQTVLKDDDGKEIDDHNVYSVGSFLHYLSK